MENLKNFSEITTKEELSELAYKLWKSSSDEYKDKLSSFEGQSKNLYTEAMKYRRIHCAIAAEIVIKIYLERKKTSRKEEYSDELKILYFATLIHDIKKFDKKHSKVGAKWINYNLRKFVNTKEEELKEICNLVRFHKGSINEYPSELLEILQISDEESRKVEKKLFETINII
ncbi:MAG: HD domain-containing protein [Clostridium sp.]|nr:HD domain-containing protein [Clostridium sp.]